MIQNVVERWHRYLSRDLPGGLDELLDDEVVFYSPVVFTPQAGKQVTKNYLEAAAAVLGTPQPDSPDGTAPAGGFHYTKQVVAGDTAVLEFETSLHGKYVNGVDIIRCDDAGRIVEFRVMIRPLQAVHVLHEQMKAMLDTLSRDG